MKTIWLYLCICIFLFTGCYENKKKSIRDKTISLPLLVITEKKLYPILDSVIAFEKQCSYYHDSIFFSISLYPNEINFWSGDDLDLVLGLHPKGYLEYNGHLFLIDRLTKEWFSFTNKQRKFNYRENNTPSSIDDRWTNIQYSYKDGKFVLTGRSSSCGDDVPFGW